MQWPKSFPKTLSIALALAFALSACSAPALTSHELSQQVDAAQTPADHEEIAKHYEREAAAARSMVEKHKKLAQTYKTHIVDGRGWGSMSAHCASLATSYEALAIEYTKMADEHRQEALRIGRQQGPM